MIEFTAAQLRGIVRYKFGSVDGDHTEYWCVGGAAHVRVDEPLWPRSRRHGGLIGPCDGSCRDPKTDVRALVAGLGRGTDEPVDMDEVAHALLRTAGPLRGIVIDDGYCKRNSEWTGICAGGHHVTVTTDFAWASPVASASGHRYEHRVRAVPCDGMCRAHVPADRESVALMLRAVRTSVR